MKRFILATALASAVGSNAGVAEGQQGRTEKAALPAPTMVLIPANARTPAAVTSAIELPRVDSNGAIGSARGAERKASGPETPNRAREDGRAFGEATAAAARDNRENATRARAKPATTP
jgi:hypothetical protein